MTTKTTRTTWTKRLDAEIADCERHARAQGYEGRDHDCTEQDCLSIAEALEDAGLSGIKNRRSLASIHDACLLADDLEHPVESSDLDFLLP